jgi:tyrosyl-tRNA synthetase
LRVAKAAGRLFKMDSGYLSAQITTIIGQLHGLFDDIGVPSHERDTREAELFSALSKTLHSQLRQVTKYVHRPKASISLLTWHAVRNMR